MRQHPQDRIESFHAANKMQHIQSKPGPRQQPRRQPAWAHATHGVERIPKVGESLVDGVQDHTRVNKGQVMCTGPGGQGIRFHLNRQRAAACRSAFGLRRQQRCWHGQQRAHPRAGQADRGAGRALPLSIQGRVG